NESFATFSELLQLRHLSQPDYENELKYYEDSYFREDSIVRYAMYNPPPGYLFGVAEYYKGAWVLKMLKDIVGDSTFFEILREYRRQFAYRNVITYDFVAVVNKVTQTDMSWFFDQWIFQPGYPIYSLYPMRIGDSLLLTVTQTQTNAPIFKMPVEIGVYSNNNMSTFQFWDSLRVQVFTILSKGGADSIIIDPNSKLLAKYRDRTTGSISSSPPNRYFILSNYPNPFNNRTNILYYLPRPSSITLTVYDVVGRKVRSLENGYQQAGLHLVEFNSEGLSSGVYLCKLITSFGNLTTKLVLEK
ncbi:MAG: M1 family aminopeptidase, partial [Candidatus Kryptoniota bacterium]